MEFPDTESSFADQAPPTSQSQLLWLEAERARLAAALEEQTEALERRTAELEQSRARFRDVIEGNADAIIVVSREGVIQFANGVAAELFQKSREELLGTHFGFPMVAGETTDLDLVHGGQVRVVEMRVVESEWEGQEACIASLRDITGRKRAEEAARRLAGEQAARTAAELAARRFRLLAESSAVLASSLEYRVTLPALARLCVAEFADWVTIFVREGDGAVQRLEVAHHDPAKSAAVRAMRDHPIAPGGTHPVLEVLRSGTARLLPRIEDSELRSFAEDDRHAELLRELGTRSFMLVPLVARGRALGAIALVRSSADSEYGGEDLALARDLGLRAALAVDNARLYAEAREASQAKTDLLAVISHDLRTPLNAIMGHAELLEMGIPDALSPESLERVGRIRTSSKHLLYLIDQLLSFARLESGREEVRPQEVDARLLVKEVAAVVEPLAMQRDLGFRVDCGDRSIVLQTDPDKLRQVLLNLTGNAVKYTSTGEVRLRLAESEDGRVIFDVEDTGDGIPDEHLPHIFEPFWQADPTQRSRNGGTGLGLSVVKRVVQLLGGEVKVRSAVGEGSTFCVVLPRALSPMEEARELEAAGSARA